MANYRSDIMLLGYLLRIMAKIFVRDLQYTLFPCSTKLRCFHFTCILSCSLATNIEIDCKSGPYGLGDFSCNASKAPFHPNNTFTIYEE